MATAAPEIPALARDLAFERLYRRYVKDVYRYALALLRNPADAEDVTQTTFLNAYRAFKRGEEPLKPHNWLIKIAHNTARTRYARSTRRVKEVPLEDHVDSLTVPEDDKPDVRVVLDALGRLPLNQRAALVMRELEGRSYADIADTLGVSVPAVETLIFRARRSLKLKASAVRVLGVVQLPPSLAQLLGGGSGVVAGGGAAVGSGLALKTVVALVAGAVATGIGGGDQSPRAEAAGVPGAIASPPWTHGVGSLVRTDALAAIRRESRTLRTKADAMAGPGIASSRRSAPDQAKHVDAVSTGGGHVSPPVATSTPASSPAATTVESASQTVKPVTETVVPPLPVPVPVPVPVPQPQLPATPPLPAVPAVQLPPSPQLPTLP